MEKIFSFELAEKIKEILDDTGIHYTQEDNRIYYALHSMSKEPHYLECKAIVNEIDFSVFASYPFHADHKNKELMNRVAEFICRANFGLRHGNFEFDFRDGEILYKITADCEGDNNDLRFSDEIIKNALQIPSTMIRRYTPGLNVVLFGGADPAKAVKNCEEASDSSDDIEIPDGLLDDIPDNLLEFLRQVIDSKQERSEGGDTPDPDDLINGEEVEEEEEEEETDEDNN